MEQQDKNEAVALEKCVLSLFSILNLILFLVAERLKWGNYISLLYLVSIFIMWFVHLNHYFEPRVRGFMDTILMQCSLLITVYYGMDFTVVLLLIIGVSVMTGLLGDASLINLSAFFAVFTIGFEWIRNRKLYQAKEDLGVSLGIEIILVILIEYTLYYWVKKKSEVQKHVQETIRDLHIAEQSKTDFLCNVSHELRTPINTICGISEIAQKEKDVEQMKEEIAQMHMAGKRLLSVVSDILDFSELQSGNVEVENEVYDLNQTIQDLIQRAYSLKEEKNIEILFNIDGNLPKTLLGDEKKIRRVVLNLVSNAIKFTKEGYVLIRVSHRKETYGTNLCFEIKDTGIGMKQEDQERLFTSFTQIDGSRKRSAGGIGLGLSISQMLVRQMGGLLSVNSIEGKGTTIKVVIPQEIVDDLPMLAVKNKEDINVAVYMDLEHFELEPVRDAYAEVVSKCMDSLGVRCHFFRSFNELNRRITFGNFTHLYMSLRSYQGNQPYFDSISSKMKMIVVREPSLVRVLHNPDMIEVAKPINLISLVEVLNSERDQLEKIEEESEMFLAPTARVLIVDDNKLNLLVAKRLLETYQIQVTTAVSGREAISILLESEFDLIFMDHMMPEMDGTEALHEIRNLEGNLNQKIPVIVLTANAVAGSRGKFIEDGFTDFMEKPIDLSVLERKCRKYIPQNKQILENKQVQEPKQEPKQESKQEPVIEEQNLSFCQKLEAAVEDLSTKDGLIYCREEAIYQDMLLQCAKTGFEHIEEIEQYYQKNDWKNFTIAIHAAKSATKTIGALKLSDACKELELLGKEWSSTKEPKSQEVLVEKIKSGYPDVKQMYEKFIQQLCQFWKIEPEVTKPKQKKFERTEQIQEIMKALEEAAYDWDGEKMLEILATITEPGLQDSLEVVRDKIEKCDYISAQSAFERLFIEKR